MGKAAGSKNGKQKSVEGNIAHMAQPQAQPQTQAVSLLESGEAAYHEPPKNPEPNHSVPASPKEIHEAKRIRKSRSKSFSGGTAAGDTRGGAGHLGPAVGSQSLSEGAAAGKDGGSASNHEPPRNPWLNHTVPASSEEATEAKNSEIQIQILPCCTRCQRRCRLRLASQKTMAQQRSSSFD